MRKIFKVVMLTLSLTSCAEVTEGLRDISQGTFVKKRVECLVEKPLFCAGSHFYPSIDTGAEVWCYLENIRFRIIFITACSQHGKDEKCQQCS